MLLLLLLFIQDSDWDADVDEDDRVFEELRTYYKCVYGIKNRKKRNISVYNDSVTILIIYIGIYTIVELLY